MAHKRIGILTGGGDAPGLNMVIKSVVYRGAEDNCEVVGIRRGWEGLTHVNLDDPASMARYIMPLTTDNTRTVDRSGGTFLHSSRTNPSKMKSLPDFLKGMIFPTSQSTKGGVTTTITDVTSHVAKNLERLKLNHLIAIGGDDTLSYAAKLDKLGVKVIAVPKTMDNDVRNTEYCIGFSTASPLKVRPQKPSNYSASNEKDDQRHHQAAVLFNNGCWITRPLSDQSCPWVRLWSHGSTPRSIGRAHCC